MDVATPDSQFPEFNLDPALAETVETVPGEEIVEGILRLENPNEVPPLFSVVSRFNRICTGRFRASDTWTIRQHPNVFSLKAARSLGVSYNGEDLTAHDLPSETEIAGSTAPFAGRGCIVAALDFGLDFGHPNFLNPDGTTRLIAFWHQGAIYDAAHPNRYGYGRMFSREEINAALRTSDPYLALNYHPAISDTGTGSHGTHTLDIAAGNGRVGKAGSGSEADLMFVHLSTPRLGVVGDLGDSVRMLEGLDYVDKTARGRPWVVNLSVGRTAGSHDGTSLVEQGMHELMRMGPGKAIVQSAGNYRSANLAVQGWLRDGEHRDLQWIIDPADTTDNEIDVWYSGKDRFVIAIRPPQGTAFVEVKLGDVGDIVHEGVVVGRLYHRRNDPNNRDNHAEVFLYSAAPPGVWTVRLIGEFVITGRFHAWIERDLARPGAQSRFDASITSQSYTLGTIATSPLVITVGAYDANAVGTPVAPFSSRGPTRDDRRDKPELLAPGVGVIAARSIPRGSGLQKGLLVARSGTSMAAPHVAGTVAAMFEAAGRPVSIDEIRDCLKRSAQPLEVGEYEDCWGRLDTARAVREIQGVQQPTGISAPRRHEFAERRPVVAFEPDISDAVPGDVESAWAEQEIEVDEGVVMNIDATDSFLDRAEQAIRNIKAGRRQSETSFLHQLLRELGISNFAPDLTPAALFRLAVNDMPLSQRAKELFKIVALPAKRPEDVLRAGDLMLRVVPGTGDVGHISVLATDDYLTQSSLISEGIAAESAQPGFYGLVIEGGAYPHSRTEPFARRLLDSRGRVPPHTVILRPGLADSDTTSEHAAPIPRQPAPPPHAPGQPTGPLQPKQPSPQTPQEIRRTVTVDLSANSVSTRAFRPERNDKSGAIELVAAVRYGSLVPPRLTFRWRSEPADAVVFGNQVHDPTQGPTTIRVPVSARRPGRARVFLEVLNAQQQIIETASTELSVPQFFVVTDSTPALLIGARFTDGRQINQPATLDSTLQQLGLLNDKDQILALIQTAVERTAGTRAAYASNGCTRAKNIRFLWGLPPLPDAFPPGLPANLFTRVDLQGYPPPAQPGSGPLFGTTEPTAGPANSAENPGEIIFVFAGLFELLMRENTTAPATTPEQKDLRARLKKLGAHWRKNQNDSCLRGFMRTVISRAIANTICHEMYHSLVTIRADERGAGREPFDPTGHLKAPSILSPNRDFNARTGVRVVNETNFPAYRSYAVEEFGSSPWQTLPEVYDRRIWEFLPTPPQWPAAPARAPHEGVEEDWTEATVDDSSEFQPPSWLQDKQRRRTRFKRTGFPESVETESFDVSDEFTPPAWLRVEQRSRSRPKLTELAEFEYGEGFTFEPTGAQTDFGPKLRKAWHTMIQHLFERKILRATTLIKDGIGGGITAADAAKHLRFFSHASDSPKIKFTDTNVPWRAFPIRFGSPTPAIYKFFDEPQNQEDDFGLTRPLRAQDEYCEWQVFRDSSKKIVRVVFTSEPPEYYNFLYDPGVPSLKTFARDLLVKLYQERCGTKAITLADLEITIGSDKVYDPGNKWNNDFCVHLQQPANTLTAQIDIAARAAVVRSDASGTVITDVKTLIACDGFGDPDRQSDPTIGDNVNKLARENRFLTLGNPVGLYMIELDTTGWKVPKDKTADPQTFWKVLKGKTNKDKGKNMIVRAEFAVPASKGYTVSDIEIGGVPIEFGSQISEHLKMRLGASFGPKDTGLKGGKLAAPTPSTICPPPP